ncbi:MAG: tetratricopeptide repeat protein [bacterium]
MKNKFKIPAEKITVPLAIILAGFIALFSALEIGLRLISHNLDKPFLTSVKETGGARITILCMGDSYTVGGQGTFEDSYPKILEEKLNSMYPGKYKVFNGGVCEANSTQVLRRLKKIIGLRRIDHVILQAGSANRFNLVGYNLYKNRKPAVGEEFRVRKMIRILVTNIKGRLLKFRSTRFFERLPAYPDTQTNPADTNSRSENEPTALSGPDSSPVRMAQKHMVRGDYGTKEKLLKQAVDKNPADDKLAGQLGWFYAQYGRFDEAEAVFRKRIERDPKNYTHYTDLAECYQRHHRYSLLEATFMPGDELLPIQAQSYYMITDDNSDALVQNEIENLLKKAVKLAPMDKIPRIKLASFYAFTSRNKEAKAILKDIHKKWPDSPDACIAFSKMYKYLRALQPGQEMLNAACDFRNVPDSILADICESKGEYAKSESIHKKLIKNNPGDWNSYIQLAEFYQRQQRIEDANNMLSMGLRQCKKTAADIPPFLLPVTDSSRMTKPEKMMQASLNEIRSKPRDFHYYYYLLKTYELQNKFNAGHVLAVLEDVKRKDPDIAKNVTFMHYCSFFSEQEKWENGIYKWLANDLDEIADLCSKAGINLIIQNYPYPYYAVNKTLKRASEKHGLLFVNNQSVFDKLTRENSRVKYFKDDDHCTALGHRIISDNIILAMKNRHIIAAGHFSAN